MFDIISREIQGFFKTLFGFRFDRTTQHVCNMYCQEHGEG